MSKEAIQKEIDRLRDEKNHMWNTMLVSLGGSLTLILNVGNLLQFSMGNVLKFILSIVGFFLSYIFLKGYFNKDDEIKRLINKLEKEIQ
jgi:hypothetical protein